MRITLKELMDKLGAGYIPGPYETVPWSYYDSESGTTCSAELRMGIDGDEVEGEIQMLYDTPPEGKGTMELVCALRAAPSAGDQWTLAEFKIRGEAYGQDEYNWEEKGCDFFQAVTAELVAERMPDIDDLLDECFRKRERFADQYGGGGGKSPKIKPGALLGIKKGQGF